jgi:hypothetical protein
MISDVSELTFGYIFGSLAIPVFKNKSRFQYDKKCILCVFLWKWSVYLLTNLNIFFSHFFFLCSVASGFQWRLSFSRYNYVKMAPTRNIVMLILIQIVIGFHKLRFLMKFHIYTLRTYLTTKKLKQRCDQKSMADRAEQQV